jgi:hypothetical protein
MLARLKTLTLPFATLCVVALAITATAFASQSTAEPAEYAEYQNERWHFSLAVPADITVDEYEQEFDGQSIQFIDDGTDDKFFTISVYPYTQLDLTLGREGIASDTSDQPDHLEIVDVFREDRFMVRFEKNGVNYLVSTMPEFEPWLIEILKTWEFGE